MKTNTLTLRISDELKNQIENLGIEQSKSFSEAARSIFEDYFSDNYNLTNDQIVCNNKNEDIIQTLGFAELIFFITDKKRDNGVIEIDEYYCKLIETISKLNSHPLFTEQILIEFNKISCELKRVLYERISFDYRFKFPKPYNEFSFDYEMFYNFFHGLRYDDNNELFLTIP